MRRAAALGLLLTALAPATASAAAPAPTVLDFEDQAVGTSTDQTYAGQPFLLRDGDTLRAGAFAEADRCAAMSCGGGSGRFRPSRI